MKQVSLLYLFQQEHSAHFKNLCSVETLDGSSNCVQGYYQEAGRAGRDGKRSECVLLYAAGDIPRIVRLLRGGRGRSKAKFAKGMELLNKVWTLSRPTGPKDMFHRLSCSEVLWVVCDCYVFALLTMVLNSQEVKVRSNSCLGKVAVYGPGKGLVINMCPFRR